MDIEARGVTIDKAILNANNGTIAINGTGPEGAIIPRGSGIEIKSSKIRAQAITLNGIGGKGSELLKASEGVRTVSYTHLTLPTKA